MTNEEALKWFKDDLKYGKCLDKGPQCNAMEKAIEALEKQMVKEHHHTKIFRCNSKARESICPSCLGAIITAANEYPKYCTWCGQKIDWSDTNA